MNHTNIESREELVGKERKILWEQAIVAAGFWGISNFFYSLVSNHDFPTICLSWTGFLLTSFFYRVY